MVYNGEFMMQQPPGSPGDIDDKGPNHRGAYPNGYKLDDGTVIYGDPKRISEDNPYGSVTGPYDRVGGWGLPALPDDHCPKCGSMTFIHVVGWDILSDNRCSDCGYSEMFGY